ncbi:MAG: DUF3237 domain-containing protein [Acidimicrobiia bacterium]
MPELVYEFSYHADLQGSIVGAGPYGQRVFAHVVSGTVEGDRLKGTLAPTGGDWLLIGPDGWGRADVRIQIVTHDGAVIYTQYHGFLELTPAIAAVLGGGGEPTAFEDQYFRTSPRLETGDERYAWVNQTMFVGEGRLSPVPAGVGVDYRVYRVT